MEQDQSNSNNAFLKNFSNNAESNVYNNEKLSQVIKEQQDRHTKELEPLLTQMKKKMEEGSKAQSKLQSRAQSNIFNDNNSNSNFNNSNIMNNSKISIQNNNNNSQLGNNFGNNMNNMNNNNFYNNNVNSIHVSKNTNSFNIVNNSNNNSKLFNMNNNNKNNNIINNNSIHESNNNIMNNNNIVESINLNNDNKYSNSNSMSDNNSKIMLPSQQGLNQNYIHNSIKNPIAQFDQMNSQIFFNNSKIYEKPNNPNPNDMNPLNNNNNYISGSKKGSSYFHKELNNAQDEEQEKRDTIRKTQISLKHSLESSQYYEYETPGEKENDLNELLSDMSFYGEITKKEILREKEINPNKYISIDEAIEKGRSVFSQEGYQNEYFVLSILAKVLMNEGCIVAIEKDKPNTTEGNNELNTTVQFLVNGMYNFKKYIFHFDFGEEINNELIKNTKKQTHFNLKLKKKLLSLLKLQKNDIIMCNPRNGSYEITAIIKQNTFYQLSEEQLFQELSKDPTFSNIKQVEYNILLSGCKLNPYMLDSRGDNKDGGWGINETRGGKPYYPPQGWIGYGLRVLDRFDNGDNTWLDYRNISDNEWAVAYHGVGSLLSGSQIINAVNNMAFNSFQSANGQGYKNSNDVFHLGEKVGEGVYVTPQPNVMENHCGIINCGDKNYKVGIMTRVKPKLIRCPSEKQDYLVINGTDNEVRPYRILIKEV